MSECFNVSEFFEMLAVEEMANTHKFKKKKVARLEDAWRYVEMCNRSTSKPLRMLKRG